MIAKRPEIDRYESEIEMLPEIPPGFLESGDGPLIGTFKFLIGLVLMLWICAWVTVLPILGIVYLFFG